MFKNSIFKIRERVLPQFKEGHKVFTDILVTDNLSDDKGNLISSLVSSKKVAFDELDILPDSNNYTLEDLIKSGVNLKEVPTHGLLEDGGFDVNAAFNRFVDIINSSRQEVAEKPVINNTVNETPVTENPSINI